MTEIEPVPAPVPTAESFTWWQAWWYSVSHPSVEMYTKLVEDPRAGKLRSLLWVAIVLALSLAIGYAVGLFIVLLLYNVPEAGAFTTTMKDVLLYAALSFIPLVLVGLGLFLAYVGICHLLARALGGRGSFWKLVYTQAVYQVSVMVVSTCAGLVPVVGFFTILIPFYAVYLDVVGIKAVHRISWGRSAAAGIIPYVLVIAAVIVMVFVTFYSNSGVPDFRHFNHGVEALLPFMRRL